MRDNQIFQVIFDGKAFASNEIPARELVPCLVALSDFLEEANAIINDDKTKIQVNIKGTFKTGCFHIDFSLWHSLKDNFVSLFNKQEVIATTTFLSLLGISASGVCTGLIGFIKWLKNREIKKIIPIADKPNKVQVIVENEEKIEIEKDVIKLYQSQKIRMSLDNFFSESLSKEGYETIALKLQEEKEFKIITKEEATYFKSPEFLDEPLPDDFRKDIFQVVSISFKDDNKWRFSDGTNSFFATITDNLFLEKVKKREVLFGSNDLLTVEIRVKKCRSAKTGLKTEYIIEKVIEHLRGGLQLKLPIEED